MKNLTAKYFSLLVLASLLSGNAHASRDDGYMNGGDCCPRQYECGCNPLYCGAFDVQVQAGVAPITWRNRGAINGINCSLTPSVVALFNATPNFRKFFKIPWIVGGQIGYAMSDNTRVFVEFDYSQANGKDAVALTTDFAAPAGAFTFTLNKYKLYEGYVGARYYWDRWCDHLSIFVGGKVGFVHHKKQNVVLAVAIPSTITAVAFAAQPFNKSNTVVSGGGHIGLDYCICGNWSLVLTGEVVASCGPRGVGIIALGTTGVGGVSNFITPSIGTELRFPVTLAVRYSF
jgi:hypothetical protein